MRSRPAPAESKHYGSHAKPARHAPERSRSTASYWCCGRFLGPEAMIRFPPALASIIRSLKKRTTLLRAQPASNRVPAAESPRVPSRQNPHALPPNPGISPDEHARRRRSSIRNPSGKPESPHCAQARLLHRKSGGFTTPNLWPAEAAPALPASSLPIHHPLTKIHRNSIAARESGGRQSSCPVGRG